MRRTIVWGLATMIAAIMLPTDSALALGARVVGGTPTTIVDWPSVAYLELRLAPSNVWMCGGVVVAPRLVLTAAHCVIEDGVPIDAFAVTGVVGSTTPKSAGGTSFRVERIAIHPSYNRYRGVDGGPYDAAVLQTNVDLPAPPMGLLTEAEAVYASPGVVAQVAGWGATSASGSPAEILMQADVPIVSDEVCAANNQIPLAEAKLMVCAGREEGGVDSCQGDSGGPLRVLAGAETPDPTDDRWLLAGLVSWGYVCGDPRRPGLYSRVSTYASWVGQLGANEAAWARASDTKAPRVRLRAGRQSPGRTVLLRYRVTGEVGPTRQNITIRRTRGGTVLRRIATRAAVNRRGADAVARWVVPRSFSRGGYVWCMTSLDQAGNRSPLTCATLTIR